MDPIISVAISIVAVTLAGLSFYYNYLKGCDIILLRDELCMPEIKKEEFKRKEPVSVPYSLPVTLDLFFYNKGNRAGAIKDVRMEFNPVKEFDVFFDGFRPPSPEPLILRDKDAELISNKLHISLNPLMYVNYSERISEINIKAHNLRDFLEKLREYKKDILENFIDFLRSNEKLGDMMFFFSKTGKKYLLWKDFIHVTMSIEVKHSYSKTLNHYQQSLLDYNLYPSPEEIISRVIYTLKRLKTSFKECMKDFERYNMDETWCFYREHEIREKFVREKNIEIEMLKKCQKYSKFVIKDLVPLLRNIDIHGKKVSEVNSTPSEEKQKELLSNLRTFREDLKANIENIIPKLNETIVKLEKELE